MSCACGIGKQTKTIYIQTQSVRTLAGQEIRTDYTYSANGTPISVKTYFNDRLYQSASVRTSGGVQYMTVVDKEGTETTQVTNTVLDENGNVASVEISVGGNAVSRTRYTYDDQNRVTNANTVTTLGNTDMTYAYDDNGNLIEQINDDETEDTYVRTVYTYNDKNYVVDEKSYDRDGVLQSGISYTYSEDESIRTASYYDAEGNLTGEVVTSYCDEHGNVVREETAVDGEVLQVIVNTYEALEVPVE